MATTTATLLFTDLVGSTESLSRVGEERAEIVRREHFGLLRESVREHGGREIKNVGDGLMVAFDAVTNALWCAVGMQQSLEARNRVADEPLNVRVGIATGEADVEAGDYFGVPVIEAARLCARAQGGEILATHVVRLLAGTRGDFEFESVGALELKGLDTPVETFRVRWVRSAAPSWRGPLPSRLTTSDRNAFVGRTVERALLGETLKHVVEHRGRRVVLASGEAGIGKTAIIGAFGQDAYDAGAVVLYGHSDEDLVIPYQPWAEVLGQLVEVAPESLLSAHVAARDGDLLTLVPTLRDRVDDVPPARSSDPDAERHLLFGAAVDLLRRASAQAPLVLFLDDLHWADRGTLQLLRHVAASSVAMPLLIVGTFRDSDLASGHPLTDLLAALHREDAIERVMLRGFDDLELLGLMELAAGHAMDRAGLALRDELAAETDGNPFFVIEILRHLVETGAIAQGDDGRWIAQPDLRSQGLPVSVREVVGRRVARLGEEATRVLSLAAVIGRDFDLPLLAAASGIDADRLLDVMDTAARAVVVDVFDDGNDRYAFTHALIHRAIYDDLSPARRRRLHERVAEALESSESGASRVGELARHWYEAAQPVSAIKAYQYAMAAGDAARLRLAPDEAARWYGQAVDLADSLDDAQRARCETLVRLGDAQRLAGNPGSRQTLLDAAWLARDLGDSDRLVAAALANTRGFVSVVGDVDRDRISVLQAALDAVGSSAPVTRARLLAQLSYETHYIDDIDTVALIDEALALTEASTDEGARADALFALHLYFTPSTLARRLATVPEYERIAAGGDPLRRARMAMSLAPALWQVGDVAGIRRQQQRLLESADELGDPSIRWVCTWLEQIEALVVGDHDRADRLASQALQEGLDAGQPDALLFYGAQLTSLRSQQGRAAEIIDTLIAASEAAPGIPVLQTGLALMHANVGHIDEARAILDHYCAVGLEEIPESPLELSALGGLAGAVGLTEHVEMARMLIPRFEPYRDQFFFAGVSATGPVVLMIASCARVIGDFAQAEQAFREALPLAEQMEGPYWIALTKLVWSQLLIEQGDASDLPRARDMLHEAKAVTEQYGFGQLDGRAREFLDRVS